MRFVLQVFAAVLATAAGAHAQDIALVIANISGKELVSITATPIGEPDVIAHMPIAASIASGESGDITVASPAGQCVFNLTFAFADQSSLERPNTDLCQSDSITIE